MDILTSIVYMVLFIVLMIFIFSMGLLTPILGEKGKLPVVTIGLIAGLIAGSFFIAPIYEELPYVVGSTQQIVGDHEIIEIEISTLHNASRLIKEIGKINGVNSVQNGGLYLETSSFSNERKKIIEEKIPIVDENFKSWEVSTNGRIRINITDGYDANKAIATLSDWLMYTAGITTKYSIIKIKIDVRASSENEVINYLNSKDIVITSTKGPIQGAIDTTKDVMVSNSIVAILTGVLGIFVALSGIYFDEIYPLIKKREYKEALKTFADELLIDIREINLKESLESSINQIREKGIGESIKTLFHEFILLFKKK